MKMPLVSVVIPVYNTGASATELIQTLLKSSYRNLEIIAVDDGSTDDTLKYLRAIKDPLAGNLKTNLYRGRNSRLRVLHQKNSGASSARNLGIKHATGRYIAFFDSDDSVDPEIIRRFVEAYREGATGTDASGGDVADDTSDSDAVDDAGSAAILLATCAYRYHRVRQNSTEDIYTNPPVSPQPGDTFKAYILRLLLADGRLYAVINKLFVTEVIRKHQLEFDTNLNFAEDTRFVLEYLQYAYDDIIFPEITEKMTGCAPENSSHDIDVNYSPDDIKSSDFAGFWQKSLAFLAEPLYHYNYGTATSTVAFSSLPWQNWQTSYDNLVTWLGTHPTNIERKLLKKVRLRWKISHALAVGRANLTLKEKRQYLSLPRLFLAKIALFFRK